MRRAFVAVFAFCLVSGHALAASPEPKKPLDLARFMGRWYEILRTPNGNQKNCFAAYQDWSRKDDGRFSIVQNCHRDSPEGEKKTVNTSAKLTDTATNAKFEASFFGGIIKARYWVVDHADDYSWMIATTEDGKYPALLSREPTMPAGEETRLKSRMAALGFDIAPLKAFGKGAAEAKND